MLAGRWAAIRSFLNYALAVEGPEQLAHLHQALAITLKRCSNKMLECMTRDEMQAVLQAPDAGTWSGQRDRLLFQLLYNTGARVSEIIAVRVKDLRDYRSLQLLERDASTGQFLCGQLATECFASRFAAENSSPTSVSWATGGDNR
jgi:site-specific recombinase XerD